LSKNKSIDTALTVWCNSTWGNHRIPYEHEGYHQQANISKISFIKLIESYNWKFIKGSWYCPACSKVVKNG